MARNFKLIFLLSLTLLMILGTTSFASNDWDLSYEKELFIKCLDYYQYHELKDHNPYVYSYYYNDNFINNFFERIKIEMESSNYSKEDYPLMLIRFYENYCKAIFSNNIIPTNSTTLWDFGDVVSGRIELRFDFDTSGNILNTSISLISGSGVYMIAGGSPMAFFISDYQNSSIIINDDEYVPWMTKAVDFGLNFSAEDLISFNPDLLENSFILNKEFFIGNNFNYTFNYYYYENDEKISINDYISFEITETWCNKIISPYIDVLNIENIPNDKTFYFDLNIVGKNTTSSFTKSFTGIEVFKTTSKTEPIIPEDPDSGDSEGESSGDTGGGTTTPSGDTGSGTTGEKLDNINNQLENTNNKLDNISGELSNINNNLTTVPDISGTTIGSGDIEDALNFDFAEDPYSNFWYELTTGLGDALTGNNRSIKIDFRNKSYNINLDDFSLQVPQFLKSFLTIISTVLVVWQMIRYVKIIIDKISSGNMDEVLAMNEEERNCRLILRGDIFVRSFI